jgi:uncharacterized protein DUF11
MRRLVAVACAVLVTGLAAPVATAEETADLGLIATLDKNAYLPGDIVTMRVLVMNNGPGTATGVVVHASGDLAFTGWGKLADSGLTLEPGEQVPVTVTAPANDTGAGMTERLEVVSAEPDADPTNNQVTVNAFVTAPQADLALTVYADADRDGVVDPGESKVGMQVTVSGGLGGRAYTARAGQDGVAHFAGIPGGEYSVKAGLPADWYLDPSTRVRLRAGQNDIAFAARYVDASKLRATVTLDRPSYAVGDTVRERVTLTNTGSTDLTDITAHCGSYTIEPGNNELYSRGWGDLDTAGPGAVVRAGETRTWEFTDVVRPRMWDYGFALLRCEFIVPGMIEGAFASARAAVPGGHGTMGANLVHEGRPAPDVQVLLIDKVTGDVAARATSDGNGRFEFPEVPADAYELRPLGPWRVANQNLEVQVLAGEHVDYFRVELLPGPVQRDPEAAPAVPPPSPQQSPAPTPQASRPIALADTGADVAELIALGALLVVVGALMRRRPA